MIPRPTSARGDRLVLVGCLLSLIPIGLVLGVLLLVYSFLNSCARSGGPFSHDPTSSDSSPALPAPVEPEAPTPAASQPPQPRPTAHHQLVDTANALADASVQSGAFQKATDVAGTAIQIAAAFPTAVLTHALTNMANDLVAQTPALHAPPAPLESSAPAEQPTAPEPPPPPAPHLRHIRWGMTPDEVLATESPLAPLRATPTTLLYATTTLDLPCHLTYSFRSARLTAARLQFSLPSDDDVPALSPVAAHAAYLWLRSQLTARYGHRTAENRTTRPRDTTHLADRAARSREDAEAYAATLAAARQRLATRTAQLKEKYRNWPEAAARIDRELASERRYVADLEAWVRDLEATERDAQAAIDQSRRDDTTSPLPARDTASWQPSDFPHAVALIADYTTTPSRLEIRYTTTLPLFDDI